MELLLYESSKAIVKIQAKLNRKIVKANKRNNYEDKSSHVKEKIGENQADHEKIKSLLLKDE